MPREVNRHHIIVNDHIMGIAKKLKQETGASSISAVFLEAVKYYSLVIEEQEKGSDLVIRDKTGKIERLRLLA